MRLKRGWSDSHKLRHQRERMMSEEHLVVWGVAADRQLSWPEAVSMAKNHNSLSLQVIFIQVWFSFIYWLHRQGTDEKFVVLRRVLFLTPSLFLAALFTGVCRVWDPTQRIAQSVSFTVTLVGVPLVACFFSFTVLFDSMPIAECFLLILTAHASCTVEEPILHSTGVTDIYS